MCVGRFGRTVIVRADSILIMILSICGLLILMTGTLAVIGDGFLTRCWTMIFEVGDGRGSMAVLFVWFLLVSRVRTDVSWRFVVVDLVWVVISAVLLWCLVVCVLLSVSVDISCCVVSLLTCWVLEWSSVIVVLVVWTRVVVVVMVLWVVVILVLSCLWPVGLTRVVIEGLSLVIIRFVRMVLFLCRAIWCNALVIGVEIS